MASLAGMLKQRGFRVTGSDARRILHVRFSGGTRNPVAQPFDARNLDLRRSGRRWATQFHGETRNWSISSTNAFRLLVPQLLHDEFLQGKEVLVVAGTHAKPLQLDAGMDFYTRGCSRRS